MGWLPAALWASPLVLVKLFFRATRFQPAEEANDRDTGLAGVEVFVIWETKC